MPEGKRFSAKEDRQAGHVAASMRRRGRSAKEAKRIGYATVVARGGGRSKRKSRK
jgi:hypothetical protein